jgi:hypothetical protein
MAFLAIVAAMLLFGAPMCPVAILTHHPCPGCGMTRAAWALLHGDVSTSLHLHPLAGAIVPIVVVSMARSALGFVRTGAWGAGDAAGAWMTPIAFVLVLAMLGVWIARFFGFLGGPVAVGLV